MLDADWDREAARFDLASDHGLLEGEVRRAWRRLLQAHLPPAPAQVLDIGCGTGSLSILLAEEGHAVSGVDFSSEMLARASSKTMAAGVSVSLARANATCLPIRRGAVDVVVCRHVLWALDDIDGVLEHWSELLRPTGRLLLIEGQWSTGVGLRAVEVVAALGRLGKRARVEELADERLWGRPTEDERYIVHSRP